MTTVSDWTLQSVNLEDVRATDLRQEGAAAEKEGSDYAAYRLWNEESHEVAYLLFFPETERAGIAYGADALWTDCTSPADAVRRWLDGAMVN